MRFEQARKILLLVASAALVAYVIAFFAIFEPFTAVSLVGPSGEFLGPPLRQHPEVEDLGKLWVYRGSQGYLYLLFKPMCVTWGVFNAFTWWLFV